MDQGRYDDIIDLPHHVSTSRRRMSDMERAAQFSPFAALLGYDDAIREEGRLTSGKVELAEDEKQELDRIYRLLHDTIREKPRLELTYFCPDERKQGGSYVCLTARAVAISAQEQQLFLEDGSCIPFSDIRKIEL